MSEPNYYELLGVDLKASKEEMWMAYRRRQEEWVAEQTRLDALIRAWSVLGDEALRRAYDKKLAKLSKPPTGGQRTETRLLQQGQRTTSVDDSEDPPTEILSPVPIASLTVIPPSGEAKIMPITSPLTTIGRKADNSIVLPDKSRHISRYHAEIRVKGGQYYIIDNNSKNGTALNGRLLPSSEERELRDGDEINIEGRALRFALRR